ncbi:hypothetical protein [Oricola indica]|uniref:hypothetical protein n=1 Tax=Oricola indica TaxID=2872591 RepID=UPI003CCC10D7
MSNRRKSLIEADRLQFVQDATDAHHRLAPHLIALSPLSDDYKAVLRLSKALRAAIRDVTGDDPEWCKVKPGAYPGR